jgi:hypothetical protein
MRILTAALAIGLLAAPALAQTPAAKPANDTIKVMIEKGVKMSIMGFEGEITYTADGKWSGFDGQASGTYTTDGDKLCTASDQGEGCATYPAGKKSGDKFTVTFEGLGDVEITIK